MQDAPLVSERLEFVALKQRAASQVVAGARQSFWADGFPQDGDMVVARLVADNPPQTDDGVLFGHRHLICRECGLLIGTCGFFGPPGDDGVVNIGYGVVPEFRGLGYATEALRAMIDLAATDARVLKVAADTSHENLASQRVMERAGMTRVRTDDALFYYEIVTR